MPVLRWTNIATIAGPPPAVTGSCYYFDTNGSDSNTGRSTDQAWKTLSKFNGTIFAPGDTISFKRGQTFSGTMTPLGSGTSAAWITIGAYGTGANPIIDGSAVGGAFAVTNMHHTRIENIDFSGSNGTSQTFYFSGCYDIYMYNVTVRDSGTNTSGASADGYNITWDSCIFRNNYKSGLLASSLSNHDYLVLNCLTYSNGHSTSADHGMYVAGGVVINGCTAYSNSCAGFKLNDNEVESFVYPTVKNSVAYNNYDGIILTHKRATAINNLAYGNTDANLAVYGNAWGYYTVMFNTFVNATSATYRGIIFSSGYSLNSVYRNNVFIQDLSAVTKGCLHFDTGAMSNYASMFDYNTYYMNGSLSSTSFAFDSGGTRSWNEWVAAGAEAHGTYLTSLPDFTTRYTDMRPFVGNLTGLGIYSSDWTTDSAGAARTAHPTPGYLNSSTTIGISSATVAKPAANVIKVTFSHAVYAADYKAGWTIKENGVAKTISSAERQTNNAQVWFTLSTNITTGTTVTAEYAANLGSYQDSPYAEITLGNVITFTVTNNVMDIIANLTFEKGNLVDTDAFTSVTDPGSKLSVTAGAALNSTTKGFQILIDGTSSRYGSKSITADACKIWCARIFFDPNTSTMGANETYTILCLLNGANIFAEIEINYNGGYDARARSTDDVGAQVESARIYFSDAPHRIELKVTTASAPGANDGSIEISVDGGAAQTITTIDNDSRASQLDSVDLGCKSLDAGTSGTIYVDELKINNTGVAIGA